jgi:AbrB family looped-hinge helix DNA binding protein
MSKVTSKLQLTVPKAIADQYGIRPGDELRWTPAGEGIRIELGRVGSTAARELTAEEKLRLFDAGSERLNRIQTEALRLRQRHTRRGTLSKTRGWKREDLYDRGFPR